MRKIKKGSTVQLEGKAFKVAGIFSIHGGDKYVLLDYVPPLETHFLVAMLSEVTK